MARILFAWELGGGLGHIGRFRPIAAHLLQKGHSLALALRDLSQAVATFGDLRVEICQAPVKTQPTGDRVEPIHTFAHILNNVGFASVSELAGMMSGWRLIFEHYRPDLVICDHSPVALLVARKYSLRRVLIGTGFCCPDDTTQLPALQPWSSPPPMDPLLVESRVLQNINSCLASWELPTMQRTLQMYAETDEKFLMTFPEMDHFSRRNSPRYWGSWPMDNGAQVNWPAGDGPRVFAYLKPFPGLPSLLEELVRRKLPTIIWGGELDRASIERFSCRSLMVATQRLDMTAISRSCGLAILNGSHNSTATMLLAGVPILQIPLQVEQLILSRKLEQQGFALFANRTDQMLSNLDQILFRDSYRIAARDFAAHYASFSAESQPLAVANRIDELLN